VTLPSVGYSPAFGLLETWPESRGFLFPLRGKVKRFLDRGSSF
jgi:hypothetical protein